MAKNLITFLQNLGLFTLIGLAFIGILFILMFITWQIWSIILMGRAKKYKQDLKIIKKERDTVKLSLEEANYKNQIGDAKIEISKLKGIIGNIKIANKTELNAIIKELQKEHIDDSEK